MSDSKPEPRIPEIGEYVRGPGTLVEVLAVDPLPQPPPTHDYVFESVTARVDLRLGDETISRQRFGTWWDFAGKDRSVRTAIETAREYADEKQLGPDSDIEVVAIKTTERTRTRPTGHEANRYDAQYRDFTSLTIGSKLGMPPNQETVVWSSKHPELYNEDAGLVDKSSPPEL